MLLLPGANSAAKPLASAFAGSFDEISPHPDQEHGFSGGLGGMPNLEERAGMITGSEVD